MPDAHTLTPPMTQKQGAILHYAPHRFYRKRQASSLPDRLCFSSPLMWRLLHSSPSTGAFNMALDEALMYYAAETGSWIFRVYGWSGPTLSLGRNQTARGAYDLDRLASRGIDVVRRPT